MDSLLYSDHRSIPAALRDGPVAARVSVIRGKLSEVQRMQAVHAAAVLMTHQPHVTGIFTQADGLFSPSEL